MRARVPLFETATNNTAAVISLSAEWRIRPYDALQWVVERRRKPFTGA